MSTPRTKSKTTTNSTVVIAWDAPSFTVGKLDGQWRSIDQRFQLRQPVNVQSEDELGDWLRAMFRQNGIDADNAVVVVPRRHITTELLEIPAMEEQEIAAFCLLQAKSRLAEQANFAIADYVLPPIVEDGTAHVFLSTLPQTAHSSIMATTARAGLQVKHMVVAELVAATSQESDSDGLVLHVLEYPERIEFIAVFDGCPIAAQTFPFLDKTDQVAAVMPALGARVLQSLPSDFRRDRLAAIQLYGEQVDWLASYFEAYFETTTVRKDSIWSLGGSLLAAGQASMRSVHQIDFANAKVSPKLTVDTPPTPWIWPAITSVAAVFLLTWCAFTNHQLDSETNRLKAELRQLQSENKAIARYVVARDAMSKWDDSRINWPAEIAHLLSLFPPSKFTYLDSLKANDNRNQASILVNGHAKSAGDVLSVQDAIIADDTKQLHASTIAPVDADSYKTTFTLQVGLETGDGR